MSTTNKARVFAVVPSNKGKHLPRKFSSLRLRGLLYERVAPGATLVGFQVPIDYTVQEAVLLLSSLVPEGTEVGCQ